MGANKIRVLAVEDNPADFRLLKEHLREVPSTDFEVVGAGTIKEAIQLLPDGGFEVVLMDLQLPDSFGLEGIDKILATPAAPPVIVLTELDNEETGLQALSRNAQDYLVKGKINSDMLVRSIRYAIQRDQGDKAVRQMNAELRVAIEDLRVSRLAALNITEDAIHARQQAEQLGAELARTSERLRVTLTSIGDGVIATDADGRVTFLNSIAATLTGWKMEEALGNPADSVFRVLNGKTRQLNEDIVARSLREKRIILLANSNLLVARDGREIPIEDSAAPILDANGNSMGVVLVFHDITERKIAEEALLKSEKSLIRAQEIAHLGSWELDLVEDRLTWSDEVYRIFGLQPQEFDATYEAFLEAVHPDDRAAVDTTYSSSVREGRDSYEFEHRVIRRSSGEIRFVREKCEHFRNEAGQITLSVGMVHDITERKLAEQAILLSEKMLKHAQTVANLGNWTWDLEKGEITWSDEMYRIFGIDKNSYTGRLGDAIASVVHPDDLHLVLPSNAQTFADKKPIEYRIILPDKSVRNIWAKSGETIVDENDKPIFLTGIAQDITERKLAEEALIKSEERYRSLFNGMTEGFALHEIISDENGQPCDYRFLEVNPSFERMTGLKQAEIVGKLVSEVLPDTEPYWIKAYGRVALTGQPAHFENFSAALNRHYEVFAYSPAPRQFAVLFMDVSERKRAQEMLQQQNKELEAARATAENESRRLEAVMEALPVGVAITDIHGGSLKTNNAFELLWGEKRPLTYSVDDYANFKAWWTETGKLVAPDEWASVQAIKTGTPVIGQLMEIQRFDGSRAFVINSASPIRDSEGMVVGSAVAIQDVTELRRAEQLLRKAHDELELRVRERTAELAVKNSELLNEIRERKEVERQLRIQTTAMEAAANGILITDPQGNIQWANPAIAQISGYEIHELLGQNTHILKSGLHNADFYAQMWNTILLGQVWRGELTNRRKEGDLYIEEQTITPIRDEEGLIQQFIAVKQDITEQKKVEAALEIERLRLKDILDTMPDGVYIINQAYDIEYLNPVIAREFGPVDGRKCFAYFHDQQEPCSWCKYEGIRTGKMFTGEQQYARNNKIYELFDAPLVNSDGSVSKLKLLHDITERKQAEMKLEQRNVELQALTLAEHDQRQLAEALVKAAIILNRSLKSDEVLVHILEQIKEAIPYQLADIMLLEGKTFYDASHQGELRWPEAQSETKVHFLLDDFPLMKKVMQTGQPALILNTRKEPDWVSFTGLGWSRSFLSAPLLAEGQVIGFVNLFAKQPDFFTQKMCDRLVAFAAHAAVAIQNAWLFEQVRASSERLHSLSRRLVEIQENERRYISRELHDEAGQLLTSLMVDLRLLEKKASQPEAVKKMIVEMEGSLNEVLENLHRVAMALRPASLDHLGLVAALTQHVESIGGKHGLKVSFSSGNIQKRLPPNVETVLYRIVQEALTNVVRHAHATQADVVLTERDDKLIVIIEDDGIGFDPDVTMADDHLGLFGIRERAEMIDGKLVIESAPGKGTTIIVEVDYDNTITGRR